MDRKDVNLKGKPTARFSEDMSECLVKPRAMTPFRQKITFFTAKYLSNAATFVCGLYLAIHVLNGIYPWWTLSAIPAVFFGVKYGVKFALTAQLSKGRNVKITEQQILIQKWGLFWERFNRMHEHSFSYRPHPKGGNEKEAHAFRVREDATEREAKRYYVFYQESYEIVFEYLGQPIVLMSAHGKNNAIRIVARLQAVDGVIRSANGAGATVALDTVDDWGEQAGAIGRTFH